MVLLAVDLGVKTGFACWQTNDCRLLWYRSQNFGSKARLGKAADGILQMAGLPGVLLLEGGGGIAHLWQQSASRNGWSIRMIQAEEWRRGLIKQSEWLYTSYLKQLSVSYALKAAAWGGHRVAGAMNHNTAEAILAGLWLLVQEGYCRETPWPLPQR